MGRRGTVDLTFTGEHDQKVDSKGRMSIPADRRIESSGDPAYPFSFDAGQVIYGDHLKNRIQVYTANEFKKVVARIQDTPDSDPNKDAIII